MEQTNLTTWPGWETEALIGRGSFGAVYKIHRDVLGDVEEAALKVISLPQNPEDIQEMFSEGYDAESITRTFQAHLKSIVGEYSLMRKMNGSANIVSCDDIRYIQHDNGIGWDIFIKMELLMPLNKALSAGFSEETVIRIGRDLCAALTLCERHQILHRDIKPQNIFLSPNGDYKLGDFGIAKTAEQTASGTKIGTYKYMAPEVYNNQPYGCTADIYSLGLVLYWLMNERRMPFQPLPPEKPDPLQNEVYWSRRFAGERIPAPKNGSKKLKEIVLKACAFDPKDRYQSALEMGGALDSLPVRKAPAPTLNPARSPDWKPAAAVPEAAGTVGLFSRPLPDPMPDSDSKTVGLFSGPAVIADPENPDLTVRQEFRSSPHAKMRVPGRAGEESVPASPAKPKKSRRALVLLGALLSAAAVLFCAWFFLWHDWSKATCTEASQCSICGKTKGAPLDHVWLDATCLQPKTCQLCRKTEGFTADHVWTLDSQSLQFLCSVCQQADRTISVEYVVNFPADVAELVDMVPTISGTSTDGATEYIRARDNVSIPELSDRIARLEKDARNKQSVSFWFAGWQIQGSDILLQPGESMDWSVTEQYLDGKDHILLEGLWEEGTRYNSVSFFIRLDSQSVDTAGNIRGQAISSYTPEVFNTHLGGIDLSLSDYEMKQNYQIVESVKGTVADPLIRNLWDARETGLWLYSFPTDEAILEYLRNYLNENPDIRLVVEREPVSAEDLTSENYGIYWYVFKLEDIVWHIDGILLRRS